MSPPAVHPAPAVRLARAVRLPGGARRRVSGADAAIGVALGVVGAVEELIAQGHQSTVWWQAGALVTGFLLIARRAYPFAVAAVFIATMLGPWRNLPEQWATWQVCAALIVAYTMGSRVPLRGRRGVAGLLLVAGVVLAMQPLDAERTVRDLLVAFALLGIAYFAGISLRRQIDRAAWLAGQGVRLAAERDLRARESVAEERRRVARELHDVVAHSVSVMTMQAGALRRVLGEGRERERGLLLELERLGREAVDELRIMLGALRAPGPARGDGGGPPDTEPGWVPRPLPRLLGLPAGDWVIAVLLAVGGVLVEFFDAFPDGGPIHDDPVWWSVAAVVTSGVVLVRRRWPLGAPACVVLVLNVIWPSTPAEHPLWRFVALLLLLHTAGARVPLRGRRGWAGGVLITAAVAQFLLTAVSREAEATYTDLMVFGTLIAISYAGGVLLRRQIERAVELTERNTRLSVEREERARHAVAGERSRIARELHHVVTGSVTAMLARARDLRPLLAAAPDRERRLLAGVEHAGAQAIAELDTMLATLRPGPPAAGTAPVGAAEAIAPAGTVPAGTVPAGAVPPGAGGTPPDVAEPVRRPDLTSVGDLADRVRLAGVAVDVEVEGDVAGLPPALALSAYRIIQEALTNVVKHAAATRARVSLRRLPGGLRIEVTDDGAAKPPSPASPPAPRSGGHGLIGMRERAALFGGTLTAGPRPSGGYHVRADLPVPAASDLSRP
ncbi:histidine kinase [Bailinhaonella thermotolerans]|uniref:histidine kinase n=1 Tax=Bailinhaonella thermotolerans TaxID=1070861 RepID=A0A3A4A4T2_9ACTN|nr:histidine kinase [Bailinhaonella thermotolerans]RJL20529.1 hypothetical protein D5H75_39355 [Bailinhaonella thermotolerans]